MNRSNENANTIGTGTTAENMASDDSQPMQVKPLANDIMVPENVKTGQSFPTGAEETALDDSQPVQVKTLANGVTIPENVKIGQTFPTGTGKVTKDTAPNVSQPLQIQPMAYDVRVPENVKPGQTFSVTVNGFTMSIICPQNLGPENTVRIYPPVDLFTKGTSTDHVTSVERSKKVPEEPQSVKEKKPGFTSKLCECLALIDTACSCCQGCILF
mmetsp:Transcript_3264/g.4586  ORF Transcript_3264/g.4586 Transcript_3264/m.4586 type:complete len:214 (-) Transcript_3264:325-966(-)